MTGENVIAISYKIEQKKRFTQLLYECKMIDEKSVGQIVLHINNGGVMSIRYNNWEIK